MQILFLNPIFKYTLLLVFTILLLNCSKKEITDLVSKKENKDEELIGTWQLSTIEPGIIINTKTGEVRKFSASEMPISVGHWIRLPDSICFEKKKAEAKLNKAIEGL